MSEDFSRAVVNLDGFNKFCEQHGYSNKRVLTSIQFEADKKTFDSMSLAKLGLLDPQFASEMPTDESIQKSILPFSFVEGSVFAMVYGKPNVVVKEHSHTKGFLRVVMFGEYTFTGLPDGEVTLKAGDWVYIPKGQKYGYRTGANGGGGGCCYCTNGRG